MILEWVRGRTPEAPEAFLPFLDSKEPPSVDGLLQATRRELTESLGTEAGERRGAFALLAADAYLTYACARVLEEGGGPAELKEVVSRLVEGLP